MELEKLSALFEQMTLEDKFGQMTQTTGEHFLEMPNKEELVETGPSMEDLGFNAENIYQIGSVLGVSSTAVINEIQRTYLKKSRLKIPLLFMHDAIHGYRTTFPIPLALASSFDRELVKDVAEAVAEEMRATGLHVNFSPMVDLSRDPRWGRVMEGFGEDSFLAGELGKSMIEGYQGSENGEILNDHVVACLKHFVAYGAPEAGKDYASVDMSEKEFYGFYARPYEIALSANPRFVMASFNSLNGEPVTASRYLMNDLLREKFGFDGLNISDWGAVGELKNHGVADSDKEAGDLAMSAGIDIEMLSNTFLTYGSKILEEKPELLEQIDLAVWKILCLKNELGLFEQPFASEESEKTVVRQEKFIQLARKSALESTVLLKNNQNILPVNRKDNLILIGPFAKTQDLLGNWACKGKETETISFEQGFKNQNCPIKAYETLDEVPDKELKYATQVIITIGEASNWSGEGHSSSDLEIADDQKELIRSLKGMGKKIIAIGLSGRPLALQSVIADLDALLWTWYLGNEMGNAVAQLVLGIERPAGRLPMSFPRVSAQVPIRYNELRSGRPANESTYSSRYQDIEIGPLFPFGFGLQYDEFSIDDVSLSKFEINQDDVIEIHVRISNHSQYDSKFTLNLFFEDPIARIVRPVRELLDFVKLDLKAKHSEDYSFKFTLADLSYADNKGTKVIENGPIHFYINDLSKARISCNVKLK
ncbi:glycoside hydrolase family 3 N-terminal domain-containing protein [Lactococcus fujiensis]|uniref:beta-glucosidase n=1 Tax=Lactococcus fujiensis JCM 16395 TaxID=1291764 RepID=A0A2A5RJ85_9LACT|nr:glycoside hydrolase family 3 N-terminal domain-containing protein [Lactococcus fujiensis]PCR99220.1 beta-glucosidase [Lactococcus fujiensis JCM 16395]